MGDDGVAGAQRLDQRGVGTPYLVAMHVGSRVKAQCLHHLLVVDGAKEHDFVTGGCLDGLVIGVARLVLAQHGQLQATRLAREALHDFEQGVLGLGPGDDAEVLARLQTQGFDRCGVGAADILGAIGNDSDATGTGALRQVHLDLGVIGHQVIAQPGAGPFVEVEPGLRPRTPLGALPFDAIHVDDVGQPRQAQQRAEDGGVVTQGQAGLARLLGVTGGDPVELDGAGRATAVDGDVDAVHAFPVIFVDGTGTVELAVDGDLPALLHQIERQVLGKGFEAAMGSRNAADAKDAQGGRLGGGSASHGGCVAQNLTPSSR